MTRNSGKHELTATIAKAYVREMLDLNPIWQTPEIIRRRREIWTGGQAAGVAMKNDRPKAENLSHRGGAEVISSSGSASDQRLRNRARRCLKTLEAEFYQLPDEKLDQYLQFLQSDRLPEFAAKASHLRRVADQRHALLCVGEETGDPKFTYSLLTSLICPAAQAGALREQYIEAIVNDRRVVPACKMVKDFVARHVDIYQLERDWFDLLLDPNNSKQWTAKYSWRGRYKKFVGNSKVNLYAAVVGLVLASVIGAISGGDSQGNRPRSRYNNYPAVNGSTRANIPPTAPTKVPTVTLPSEIGQPPGTPARLGTPGPAGTTGLADDSGTHPGIGSLGNPSVIGSHVKDAHQIVREMREQNKRFLESHQSMMDDLKTHQELLSPSISIPKFPTPNLDPSRFQAPRLRPGQWRRPPRRDGMP